MRNTKKGYIMQIFYRIPIIGFVIGKATDVFFTNTPALFWTQFHVVIVML